jgi:hypothetical protein
MRAYIELFDAFNDVLISRHKTIEAAELAQANHLKKVKKTNGEHSYLKYRYVYSGSRGDAVLRSS